MDEDYSYLGSGTMLIREYGAAAPFLPVGNCSAVNLSPQEEVKQQKDYTTPGGGLANEVRRINSVELAYTFHDFSPENFARGLHSSATTIAAGTATDETLVAYLGGYTPAAKIITAITNVEPTGGGTAYTAGTDYELRNGQLYLPSTSTIPAPVAGAANCQITYTYVAQKSVEALVNSAKKYQVLFLGLNEARSGKRVRIRCHKVSGGVLKQMALIGEEYGAGEMVGALVKDATITTAGLSQFFKVEMED